MLVDGGPSQAKGASGQQAVDSKPCNRDHNMRWKNCAEARAGCARSLPGLQLAEAAAVREARSEITATCYIMNYTCAGPLYNRSANRRREELLQGFMSKDEFCHVQTQRMTHIRGPERSIPRSGRSGRALGPQRWHICADRCVASARSFASKCTVKRTRSSEHIWVTENEVVEVDPTVCRAWPSEHIWVT